MITRLTVSGFKSFATATTLEFDAGLTAIVGPNGSGKSNLADAVRWVMGEQSKAKLRLDDRDDIIFAGADGRPRSGLAEVELVLANLPDAVMQGRSELAISRRLYRDGQSQYFISGVSAKLAEVQSLLAAASVSPSGYSVIGQGAIDALILASPIERQSLFADAAGIREPELSRAAAWRQLDQSKLNCQRLRDILAEIEPRLHHLEKAIKHSQTASELDQRCQELRQSLVNARATAAAADLQAAESTHTVAAKKLHQLQQQLSVATRELAEIRHQLRQTADQRDRLEADIAASLAQQRQLLTAVHESKQQVESTHEHIEELQKLTATQADLQQRLNTAQAELHTLEQDQAATTAAAGRAAATLAETAQSVASAQAILSQLRQSQQAGTRDQYVNHALDVMRTLASGLLKQDLPPDQVKLLVHKAGRLLSHAANRHPGTVAAQLQAAQAVMETAMHRRETAAEHQTNITISQRSRDIDLKYVREQIANYQLELERLASQLATEPDLVTKLERFEHQHQVAMTQLAEQDDRLKDLRTTLATPESGRQSGAEAAAAVACTQIENDIETVKQQLHTAQAAIGTAQSAATDAATLAQSWQLDMPSQSKLSTLSHGDPVALAAELAAATAKRDALAETNTDQQSEYHEVKNRHDQLSSQITDLEQAQADLVLLIQRLDSLIRRRFQQNFGLLAEQFGAFCARLLPGSTGKLALKADGDSYGVEITVAPRGQRPIGIQGLSGGERTLAGIALLAAILRTNPSPFVVLDEIDAALDEVNSGQVAAMLEELAGATQLIIVTHNRQTMQVASTLYGVTLNSAHLSTVISMRLDQATAIAAR